MNVAIEQTPLEDSGRLATEIARMLFAKLGPVPLVVDEVRLGAILAISFQTHKEYLEAVRRISPVKSSDSESNNT